MKLPKVLFLCTANSCRSQMAEGFARHLGRGRWEPYSAGIDPTALHPMAVAVMDELGLDISDQWSKGLDQVPKDVDLVVTVCDQAAQVCPIFAGAKQVLHWPLPDPAQAKGSLEEIWQAFRNGREEIGSRVRELLSQLPALVPDEAATPSCLQQAKR